MNALAVTRREALGAGLTIAAQATALPLLAQRADDPPPVLPWIDAHSHIWTRDVARFPLNKGQTVDDLKPPSFDVKELLQVCEPEGVGRVVLIQHHTYHGWDNSYLVHAAQTHPKRFRVVGMIDDTPDHPDQTMRALHKKHVTGIRITPRLRGHDKWLSGPGMEAMWKCAAQTRQAMCCLIDAQDLAAVDKMCQQHPDTPVVIDHFARIGVDGEIRKRDVDQLCRLARHRHTSVKISAYYALGKKQPPYHDLIPMIRRLFDTFGPQRLMWASDCPYQLGGNNTYRDSIALVRDGLDFVSAADRKWLLQQTAEKTFFSDS